MVQIPKNQQHHRSVKSEQYKIAMTHYHTKQSRLSSIPTATNAPIVYNLLLIDESTLEKMEKKFNVYYLLVKEGKAFNN